jgi:hypothetical protein
VKIGVNLFIVLLFLCFTACTGGSTSTSSSTPADATPPVVSPAAPSGQQQAGTTSVSMRVTTNENATCRYSTAPNIVYSLMPAAFTTTGATTHSTMVSGLVDGQTYYRYVKCIDSAGNADTSDATVTWSIGATGSGTATLDWAASPIDSTHSAADGYNIYRCGPAGTSCTDFSLINTTSGLTYTCPGLATGTYCFQLTAYNTGGESDPAACSGNCCKTFP